MSRDAWNVAAALAVAALVLGSMLHLGLGFRRWLRAPRGADGLIPCAICDQLGPEEDTLYGDVTQLHRALHDVGRSVMVYTAARLDELAPNPNREDET